MRIGKTFGYSKATTALLLLIAGSITLIAAGVPERTGLVDGESFIAKISVPSFLGGIVGGPSAKSPHSRLFAVEGTQQVWTDKNDYAPGDIVQISGSGFAPNESVTLLVVHYFPEGSSLLKSSSLNLYDHAGHTPWVVTVAADGTFSSSWLVQEDSLDQMLLLTADQTETGDHPALHAEALFTDANASANLDQCANDPAPSPNTDGCNSNANQWVNGNVNEAKSVYMEGDSIPYRMTFSNLDTVISHTVIIEWDTTKGSKHAIDYLTTFNRSVSNANPCLGVSGCNPASFDTEPIPKDPQVDNGSGSPITQAPGDFTLYGGTITNISAPTSVGSTSCSSLTLGKYCYSKGLGFIGDKSAAISITFTTTVANPVLAWGGHIAQRRLGNGSGGWGDANSAVSITGSPYHTSLVDLDGAGGNQDRSLSAAAVIFPGSITIIKDATPNGSTSFPFTASPSPLSNFNLIDDGTTANTQPFSSITNFQTYSVSENVPSGWSLDNIVCSVTSGNGGSQTVSLPGVNINLKEGENVTCTFTDSRINDNFGRIIVVKNVPDIVDTTSFTFNTQGFPSASNFPSSFSLIDGGSRDSCVGLNCLSPSAGGLYKVTETANSDYISSANCVSDQSGHADSNPAVGIPLEGGEIVTCTFTNVKKNPHLSITKVATESGYSSVGDIIHYTIVATNDGNVTLNNVTITDPNASGLSCTPANGSSLAVGASMTCSASHTVVQADIDAGSYYNQACVDDGAGGAASVCADVTTPGTKNPHLSITKVATESTYSHVGDVIHYTIIATNDGNTTLSAVTVTDPNASGLSCTPANGSSLTPGASLNCTATHTVTQADIDAGSYYNQACVDDGTGGAAQACADVTTPGTKNPHLSITKDATETAYSAVGQVIHYSIVATNDGNTTLSAVTVTDPNASGLSCTPANGSTLAPGASMTCTATHTVTQADLDAGSYYNQACVDDGAGGAAQVCDDVTTPGTQNPHLSITKVATENGYSAVGQVIHYTITATNDGNITLSNVTVTDPNAANLVCTPANGSSLAPGASLNCTASHTVTQADLDAGHYFNQACVDDGAGGAAQACSTVDTPGTQNPHLTISKEATESSYSHVGDVIHYTIVATNDGNVTLHNVTVSDPNASGLVCTPANGSDLAPGASMTCTATHTVVQADIDAGSYYNQACVDDGAGGAAQACDDTTTTGNKNPNLTIVKVATESGYNAVGQVIHYTIIATNVGNTTLSSVTVTDANVSDLVCTPANGSSLAPGASLSCTASHTIVQPDLDAGHFFNQACVDDGAGGADQKCSSVDTPGTQNPHLSINKVATESTYSHVGDIIHYTIVATNDGNVTLSSVTVTDPNAPGLVCTPANGSSLAPGASLSCTATHTVTQADLDAGHFSNQACVDDGTGGAAQVCDDVDTPGSQTPSIDIVKTTNGSDGIVIPVGSTITWTYVVTNSGNVTLTNVTVTDDNGTSGNPADDFHPTCPKTTLAPGESMTCTAAGTAVAGHYVNTGTAAGNPPTGNPVTDTDVSDYYSTPRLIVIKHVINNNGGTATASNFTLDSGGSNDTPDNFAGSESGTIVTLDAGSYNVSESGPSGYAASFSTYCSGTIAVGQTKTCTVTNDDIAPTLTLVKTVTNDNGGTKQIADFPLFVSGTPVTSGIPLGINAGNYTASETNQYGYTAGSWGGDCAANGSVSLSVGQNKTCTITNDDQPGTIVIIKNAKPQSGVFSFDTTGSTSGPGTSWPSGFPLNGSTSGGGNTGSFVVDAGSYTVHESTQLGWILTGIGGSTDPTTPYNCVVSGTGGSTGVGNLSTQIVSIGLKNGDTVTCTFENTGNGATRTQGFWATHPQLADIAWNGGTAFNHTFPGVSAVTGIGDKTICGRTLTIDAFGPPDPAPGNSELLGGFWASVSKLSDNKKRSAIEQARMQALQQLLAAELNASAFGSIPSGGTSKFNLWEGYLCGTNQGNIGTAQSQAAAFNSQGDSSTFTPGTSADSKNARLWSNIPFWDIVKP